MKMFLLIFYFLVLNNPCPSVNGLFLTTPSSCTTSSPCTCFNNVVTEFEGMPFGTTVNITELRCENAGLTSIKRRLNLDHPQGNFYLQFQNNLIEVLPAYAFAEIDIYVGSNAYNLSSLIYDNGVIINLSNNRISTIHDEAFKGLRRVLIDIRNNKLSTIPHALVNSQEIDELRLEGNPITTLDGGTLYGSAQIGFLSLGFGYLGKWPRELHLLRNVAYLSLYNIPFATLDMNALHGVNAVNLTIANSKLRKVPFAISSLSSLQVLSLKNNTNLDDTTSSIFESWTAPMTSVTHLEISGSNVIAFPDILRYFPNVTEIVLSSNKLLYIDTKNIMVTGLTNEVPCQVHSINLDDNEFTRIPTALSALLNCLRILSLQSNKISTIEMFDLRYLNLTELYLRDNPIKYITPYLYGQYLSVLRLDNTSLDTIPVAVTHLTSLTNFGIRGRHIECSCSMAYLKTWNVLALQVFDGFCEYSTIRLQQYIANDIQTCPDDPNTITYPDMSPFWLKGNGISFG